MQRLTTSKKSCPKARCGGHIKLSHWLQQVASDGKDEKRLLHRLRGEFLNRTLGFLKENEETFLFHSSLGNLHSSWKSLVKLQRAECMSNLSSDASLVLRPRYGGDWTLAGYGAQETGRGGEYMSFIDVY